MWVRKSIDPQQMGCLEPPKTMRCQKNFSFCGNKLIVLHWDEVFMGGELGIAGCRLIEFVVFRQTDVRLLDLMCS